MEVGGQHHATAALPPEKTRCTLYRRLGGLQGRSGHFCDWRAIKFGTNKSVGNEGRVPFREEICFFALKYSIAS